MLLTEDSMENARCSMGDSKNERVFRGKAAELGKRKKEDRGHLTNRSFDLDKDFYPLFQGFCRCGI